MGQNCISMAYPSRLGYTEGVAKARQEKVAVYTGVFHGYDNLGDAVSESICFTDFVQWWTRNWKYVIFLHSYTSKSAAVWCKTHPHELFDGYGFSIWHDGNLHRKASVEAILDLLGDADIAAYRHRERKCLYEEGKAVSKLHKARVEDVQVNMDFLRSEEYPVNNGLVDTAVIIRRHTPEVQALNELWWKTYCMLPAKRDQLTFNYVCWKLGISLRVIVADFVRPSDKFFHWSPHKRFM